MLAGDGLVAGGVAGTGTGMVCLPGVGAEGTEGGFAGATCGASGTQTMLWHFGQSTHDPARSGGTVNTARQEGQGSWSIGDPPGTIFTLGEHICSATPMQEY